tara:strand:- start:328 stop:519 length:192 start_codon:yes stop_codon:yes gene_type:complete
MIHASKLFPQALANILAQGKEEEKEKALDPIDHGMVGRIRVKRKKRARVRLTEKEKVQLTFNL